MSRKRKAVVDLTGSGPNKAAFDPKLLLNPRAALRKQASSPEKEFNVVSAIEKLHGVQERKGPVAKRKVQDGDQPKNHAVRGGSGIVGKDLQDASKKQIEKSRLLNGANNVNSANIIELSDGEETYLPVEEEEDVKVLPGSSTNVVCFGMLKSSINAFSIPQASSLLPTQWPRINCEMERGNGSIIHVKRNGTRFGVISSDTAAPLYRLLQLELCRCDGRIPSRPRFSKDGENLSGVSAVLPFEIIVYGEASHKDRISTILSQKNVFLIQPTAYDQQYAYVNPHVRQSFKAAGGIQYGTSTFKTAEEIKSEIESLFNRLQNSSALEEHETPASLKTPLLKHQRQALTFCLNHENPALNAEDHSVWRIVTKGGRKTWRNKITPQVLNVEPPSSSGGIIADEMGLGKTLSILSLICASHQEAIAYEDASTMKIKATLIVCPLSVLSNWTEQIKNHTEGGLFKVLIHHDKTRTYKMTEFKTYDVILTTYATVANEHRHKKEGERQTILPDVDFFRIVLDEAHQIKEVSTQNSLAAVALLGRHRWCLTATPVQNSLNDLAALFSFLQVSPFESRQVWNQYISQPMKSGDSIAVSRLQTLLKMKVLRRTKDQGENAEKLLSLPSRTEEIRLLKLSSEEQVVYNEHLEYYQKRTKGLGKLMSTINVLQNINQLRQICIAMALLPKLDPKPIEEKPVGPQDMSEEELLELVDGEVCSVCQTVIEVGEEEAKVYYTPKCLHFFCSEHGSNNAEGNVKCTAPGCKGFGPLLALQATGKAAVKSNTSRKKKHETSPPYSTKIKALLTDLTSIEDQSDDQDPTKSIVFSQFTSFLDLIGLALRDLGFSYGRLDGSMAREERTAQLTRFQDDSTLRIMLVSTRAGGVGLNLTMASKVFLMEPAWNPSIESQACDRVHRIGQTKPVSYTRYVVEDSIEQTM